VQDAVARERRLAFDYTRADGQKARRTVDPLGLVAKGLSWYLVARAPHGMRTYKVSRMEGVTTLALGFERPAGFRLAEYWKRSTAELGQQRSRYSAVLAVAPETANRLRGWIEATPISGDAAPEAPEGWVALQMDFDAEEHARFVILGFGTRIRVLAPVELRRWVRSEAEGMAAVLCGNS
jgi:predicted DNA-binding transcriptional regulator YafY